MRFLLLFVAFFVLKGEVKSQAFKTFLQLDTVVFLDGVNPVTLREGEVATALNDGLLSIVTKAHMEEGITWFSLQQIDLESYSIDSNHFFTEEEVFGVKDIVLTDEFIYILTFDALFSAVRSRASQELTLVRKSKKRMLVLNMEPFQLITTINNSDTVLLGYAANYMNYGRAQTSLAKYVGEKKLEHTEPKHSFIEATHYVLPSIDMHNGKTLLNHVVDYKIDIYDSELNKTSTLTTSKNNWRLMSADARAKVKRVSAETGSMHAVMKAIDPYIVNDSISYVSKACFINDSTIFVYSILSKEQKVVDVWKLSLDGEWRLKNEDLTVTTSYLKQVPAQKPEQRISKSDFYLGLWPFEGSGYHFTFTADKMIVIGPAPRFIPWGMSYNEYQAKYKAYLAENDPVVAVYIYNLNLDE